MWRLSLSLFICALICAGASEKHDVMIYPEIAPDHQYRSLLHRTVSENILPAVKKLQIPKDVTIYVLPEVTSNAPGAYIIDIKIADEKGSHPAEGVMKAPTATEAKRAASEAWDKIQYGLPSNIAKK